MRIEPTPIAKIILQYTELEALQKEDVINLELIPKSQADGDNEITDCAVHIQLNNTPIPYELYDLSIADLTKLFHYSVAIGQTLSRDQSVGVTGLKYWFGATKQDDSMLLELFFQPVFLKRIKLSETVDTETFDGEYQVIDGDFYKYGNFDEAVVLDSDAVTNYTGNISFIDSEGGRKRDFMAGTDTEAVLFPFQTLFTLLYDNDISKKVFLYNSIRKEPNSHVKHCILLSSRKMFHSNDFKGKYANRSHLCPPDCNIKFNILKIK